MFSFRDVLLYKYKEHTILILKVQIAIIIAISGLKDKFVITTVDKASNNSAIKCKVLYTKVILDEYLCNNIYLKLNNSPLVIKK